MSDSEITSASQRQIITSYSSQSEMLAQQYESIPSEQVHSAWLQVMPKAPGMVLDIGSGSGRDAAWLASKGFDVIAVEPAEKLRTEAKCRHTSPAIRWLNDKLPDLKNTIALNYHYDLILVSAVFMHIISADDRKRAFRKLSNLLKPGGRMIITLRHGEAPSDRPMADVSTDEILTLARSHALETLDFGTSRDNLERKGVSWSHVVLQLPDDGSGALPLLRHLILLDDKSSTYKLALLKVLVRIADSCRGSVLSRNDEFVTLPFGLVALYWLKAYKPLILDNCFRQQPGRNSGYGFAKEGFMALNELGHDLRIGSTLSGQRAKWLMMALRDARNTIKEMPANFLTLPGSSQKVFPCQSGRITVSDQFTVNLQTLQAFGEFKVPTHIWDTMTHYACWIEPAINNEWCLLMQKYHQNQGNPVQLGDLFEALKWKDDQRSTTQIRKIVDQLKETGNAPDCIWTGNSLNRKQYQVDHCFPYANWFNNDLWNLMPATKAANQKRVINFLLQNCWSIHEIEFWNGGR